jgi:Ran GTPase-activating protein (RanGAP) involved in mRNA processing and transport
VAEIIEKVKVFEEIDLSYNNIHSDLCDVIVPHLAKMRRINLAYNKIGRHGVELLGKTILAEENDGQLEELNLEGNGISDSAMGGLFGALGKGNSLVILNLSKNWLGNFAAARLKEYIR